LLPVLDPIALAVVVGELMLATLLYSIAGGMLVVLSTARVEQIAWRFLRVIGLLTLPMFVGVSFWLVKQTPGGAAEVHWSVLAGFTAALGAASLVVLAPMAEGNAGMIRMVTGMFGGVGLAAACGSALTVLASRFDGAADQRFAEMMTVVGQLFSALVLGSITIAWLLGHAYLTATKMTIAPLVWFSRVLFWSVVAKIAFVLISFLVGWLMTRTDGPVELALSPSILTLVYRSWLVASLRGVVGLLSVGVFAYMVADCVKLRATQSATGILYFASVFAYVGELAGQQLLMECGWPL